ncbi:predicted protein [Plenodomus lingam JN3]|uniref:Predicted protein n=1 Tax=Leptosphaeria maculans (strain JN3 / isolate v23.1.3 / race Av1-4-5-6-7-8) TaxID=985895 RepID=E4ZXL9_LEPMJ|nr:predicted protein [Plenodomus lingam JN3]CBX96114.1 predicted protein [Plenodomus lingam JN3]
MSFFSAEAVNLGAGPRVAPRFPQAMASTKCQTGK